MFDTPVREVMQRHKIVKATPSTAVVRAAKLMASRNVGAVMVVEGEKLIGIFTERDIVFRVVAKGLDPEATPLSEVMTPAPVTIDPGKPFGYALMIMHEKKFRHLPVIEHGKPIGMISSRSAMDPELEEFASEAERRRHYREKWG